MNSVYLSRLIFVVALVAAVVVGYAAWREAARSRRIQAEVESLQKEADRIRVENESLAGKIAYFSSDDFREQEAKRQLGLKKADEEVLAVGSRATGASAESLRTDAEVILTRDDTPNYGKWWRRFSGQ